MAKIMLIQDLGILGNSGICISRNDRTFRQCAGIAEMFAGIAGIAENFQILDNIRQNILQKKQTFFLPVE